MSLDSSEHEEQTIFVPSDYDGMANHRARAVKRAQLRDYGLSLNSMDPQSV